jgi:hypothetical protein
MTHGAAISNGRTFAKRVPVPSHSWTGSEVSTRCHRKKGLTDDVGALGSIIIATP